jgi:hypothetical protein
VIINKVNSEEKKDISNKLCHIIYERNKDLSEKKHISPFAIFTLSYVLDKTNLLVPNYTFGIMLQPIIIHDTGINNEPYIKISMENCEHIYKKGIESWQSIKDDLKIPITVDLKDIAKLANNIAASDITRLDIPKSENIFYLCFGNSAELYQELAHKCN